MGPVLVGMSLGGRIESVPAPRMTGIKSEVAWTSHPMTCVEMSGMLRSFLEAEDDMFLTSHSMKSTTLSWSSN